MGDYELFCLFNYNMFLQTLNTMYFIILIFVKVRVRIDRVRVVFVTLILPEVQI